MHGGVMNMKGERQMIYKNVRFKADPFSYDLEFDDRITLVGGDSGTGKTVLYEMLEDIRLTDEYKAIKLFNYKSDDFLVAIKQCRDSFIVIDNADCLINDDVGDLLILSYQISICSSCEIVTDLMCLIRALRC